MSSIPQLASDAAVILDSYLDSLAALGRDDNAIATARVAVTYSWALLAAPGHDPSIRSLLRERAARARRAQRPDTRLDPVWDPAPVRAAAFAAARASDASFTTQRRAAIVALKCSTSLARHTDAAVMSAEVTALDRDRSPIALPTAESDFDSVFALSLSGTVADKVAAMSGDSSARASFLVLRFPDATACPVRALLRYLSSPDSMIRLADSGVLIPSISRRQGRYHKVSADVISNQLTIALSAVGVSSARAAARARAATANELLRGGYSEQAVQALGRWSPGSSAFERFYRKIDLARIFDPSAGPSLILSVDDLAAEAQVLVADE